MEKIKELSKKWWFWLCLLVAVVFIVSLKLITTPKFEITDFSITKDITEYTYTDNYVTYDGKGIITTNSKGVYMVVLNQKLVSGGNENSDNKDEYKTTVLVVDGKGEFGTYDYGDESEIKKPKYEFEILGYIKLK